MKIQGARNFPGLSETVRPHPASPHSPAQAQRGGAARRFDQVLLSENGDGQSAFEIELRSRISKEVRTATTSGMVSELRQRVQNGDYRPDPTEIARRMLLLGEDA